MASFYGWGSSASRLEPIRGGSLLFTTKLSKIPGIHFIDANVDMKLISKVLASCLKSVIFTIVNENQVAYVNNRFISESGRLILTFSRLLIP